MNDRERAVQQVSIWIYDTNTTDDEVRHINDTEGFTIDLPSGSGPDNWRRVTGLVLTDDELANALDWATYERACDRVFATPELKAHADIILEDWREGREHWQWVATAPVAEIVSWAEAVTPEKEEEV